MEWRILDTGKSSAEKNMALDSELLNQLNVPTLRFYGWEKESATYGHFISPFQFLNPLAVEKHRLQLAQRPTGGGIVFHLYDFTYSVLLPIHHPAFSVNTLDNYLFVNSRVKSALEQFLLTSDTELLPEETLPLSSDCRHFCMAKPTKFDVMFQGYKVGGGAQRRTKKGFLHQGTVSLSMATDDYLEDFLGAHSTILKAMKGNSFLLLGKNPTLGQLEEAKKQLQSLFIHLFTL